MWNKSKWGHLRLNGVKPEIAHVFRGPSAVNSGPNNFCMVPHSCQNFERRHLDNYPQTMLMFVLSPSGLKMHVLGHESVKFCLSHHFKASLQVFGFDRPSELRVTLGQ